MFLWDSFVKFIPPRTFGIKKIAWLIIFLAFSDTCLKIMSPKWYILWIKYLKKENVLSPRTPQKKIKKKIKNGRNIPINKNTFFSSRQKINILFLYHVLLNWSNVGDPFSTYFAWVPYYFCSLGVARTNGCARCAWRNARQSLWNFFKNKYHFLPKYRISYEIPTFSRFFFKYLKSVRFYCLMCVYIFFNVIIIMMSRWWHGYPWPSLATPPYCSSP